MKKPDCHECLALNICVTEVISEYMTGYFEYLSFLTNEWSGLDICNEQYKKYERFSAFQVEDQIEFVKMTNTQ